MRADPCRSIDEAMPGVAEPSEDRAAEPDPNRDAILAEVKTDGATSWALGVGLTRT
jgi:hypothetical protein